VGRSSSRRSTGGARGAVEEALRQAPGALRALASAVDRRLPFARYRVEGPSMQPAFYHGERVIVDRRAYRRAAPAVGDVVVLRDPEEPARMIIKRVAPPPDCDAGARDGVYVLGDNPDESRDSRHFGRVPVAALLGRVRSRY
jgi:nickel-type superoxide dismutase maturation protease